MWIFLSNADKSSYLAVFGHIKRKILPQLNPAKIYTDYQDDLMDTLKEIWPVPECNVFGSFTSFAEVTLLILFQCKNFGKSFKVIGSYIICFSLYLFIEAIQ